MILCKFEATEPNVYRCTVCGAVVISHTPNIYAPCAVQPMGLGDMVAAGLSAIGITKERVAAIVGGDCGCQQRQQFLNEAGKAIGIGLPPSSPEPPPV